MRLRNKKTGEIRELPNGFFCGDNLKKICEEWEDYEDEPKEYWFINNYGKIEKEKGTDDAWFVIKLKQIGNYFDTREEAEKAVEKLKAVKRLKDKGFRLNAVVDTFFCLDIFMRGEPYEAIKDDLKIVFGGEE